MENKITFEVEVFKYLNIPSCPKKLWDEKTSFNYGVAVVKRFSGELSYAICSFDKKVDKKVKVIKDFGLEPFIEITSIYPVPAYMDDDMDRMDFADEDSKIAIEKLLQEKDELIHKDIDTPEEVVNEWGYPFITNMKEATAFLKSKNGQEKIPVKKDVLKAKLCAMYYNEQKNNKKQQ